MWLDRSLFTFFENLFSIKTILKDFRVRFVSMELFFKSWVVTFTGILCRHLSLWYNEDGVTLNHGREYRVKNITASEAPGAWRRFNLLRCSSSVQKNIGITIIHSWL